MIVLYLVQNRLQKSGMRTQLIQNRSQKSGISSGHFLSVFPLTERHAHVVASSPLLWLLHKLVGTERVEVLEYTTNQAIWILQFVFRQLLRGLCSNGTKMKYLFYKYFFNGRGFEKWHSPELVAQRCPRVFRCRDTSTVAYIWGYLIMYTSNMIQSIQYSQHQKINGTQEK